MGTAVLLNMAAAGHGMRESSTWKRHKIFSVSLDCNWSAIVLCIYKLCRFILQLRQTVVIFPAFFFIFVVVVESSLKTRRTDVEQWDVLKSRASCDMEACERHTHWGHVLSALEAGVCSLLLWAQEIKCQSTDVMSAWDPVKYLTLSSL